MLVAVGETSGDRLAASIVRELSSSRAVEARGVVGPDGRTAGIEPIADLEGLHAVGLADGVRSAAAALRRIRRLHDEARRWHPHVFLTVDAPSFTLRAARRVRSVGTPVVHVGAPQVWAWRAGRRRRLGASVDELLCLLPFEPDWFAGHLPATYVGHPATALTPHPRAQQPTLALLPGSRPGEVRRLWPVLRQVARHVASRRPDVRFVVVQAPGVRLSGLEAHLVASVEQAASAWAAVAASGTVTLELAALAVPQVVVYRTDPLTYAAGRRWLTVSHLALPNLVAGEAVVPEVVQQLCPDDLAIRALRALDGPRPAPLDLGGDRAVRRMAEAVGDWLPTV